MKKAHSSCLVERCSLSVLREYGTISRRCLRVCTETARQARDGQMMSFTPGTQFRGAWKFLSTMHARFSDREGITRFCRCKYPKLLSMFALFERRDRRKGHHVVSQG